VALWIFQGTLTGAWLAFIGWFLLQASASELRYLAVQDALDGLHVRNLMTREPVTVSPELTLGALMDEIAHSQQHTAYPVVEDGSPVGLLPFWAFAAVPRTEWDRVRVRDCMIGLDQVPTVSEDDAALQAVARLQDGGLRRALFVEDSRLVGILSVSDVAHAIELRKPIRAGR